jgi:small subunit ribosomal protein S7
MSRRKVAKKRLINHDPIYNSKLVNMLLSRLLRDGKKSIASKIFYSAMESIDNDFARSRESKIPGTSTDRGGNGQPAMDAERNLKAPSMLSQGGGREVLSGLQVFQQAILNITPAVEVKSRRIGGANFQVPIEVNAERGTSLALRWLVQAARQRSGREMSGKLANEILDASNKIGGAIKKKEESLRMAEANRAYASYRF